MKLSSRNISIAILVIFLILIFTSLIIWQFKKSPVTIATPLTTSHTKDIKPEELKSEHEDIKPIEPVSEYIEVTDSCGPYFESPCLRTHSEPSEDSPIVWRLRRGMVFKVSGSVKGTNHTWYKIVFDEKLLYPERVTGDLYVAADFVTPFKDVGIQKIKAGAHSINSKRIVVDLSEQTLYAYDADTLFKEVSISTGLEPNLTEPGTFNIFKKTPTRYMQGPLPNASTSAYDLPGVPWDLYFTSDGAVIHGAYWHNKFGTPQSHGCVNVPPSIAKELYEWADLGTPVFVQE